MLGAHLDRLRFRLVDQEDIIAYVAETFSGVNIARPTDGPGAGDTFFIYDPRGDLEPKRQMPFATIVTKDYGDFDSASRLNRPDVFRLNIGVSRNTFVEMLGAQPEGSTYDYAALDRVMPHPVYAPQSWVCVLNPSPPTFDGLKPLLAEAYARARSRLASASRPE
jgi:hypothetical protein